MTRLWVPAGRLLTVFCALVLSASDALVAADVQPCPTCQLNAQHRRAGFPQRVSPFAIPSNTSHYVWYYLGGGSLILDEPRFSNEGTFGWDYSGIAFHKSVALGWTHGRRYQGGTGAYRTVGLAPLHTQ
jgi:hypothetical protein